MIEKINKIVKVNDADLGYEIHTNKQVIYVMISNGASCCERWGIITTEDPLDDFIGSELISVAVVDMEYNKHPLTIKHKDLEWGLDAAAICFVDIQTSNGLLQFALYNIHNGYYGHEAYIKSMQLEHNCIL